MKKSLPHFAFKYTINSISLRLIALILATVVPIVCLFIYSNGQSRKVLLSQVENTHRGMLQSYAYQLDFQLSNARSDVIAFTSTKTDPQIIAFSHDGYSAQYAKVRLKDMLEEKLLANSFISGYFMRIPEADGYENFLYTANARYAALSKESLQILLDKAISANSPQNKWQFHTINDEDYLFLFSGNADNIYAGAYLKLSSLLQIFVPSNAADSQLYLLSSAALHEFSERLADHTMLVSYPLSNADFSFAESFSQREILASFPFLQKYTPLISVLLIIMILLLIWFIHRIVTVPLLKLTTAMHQIQDGNLDFRIPQTRTANEFTLVNSTFNRMVSEIQGLKISVYEQQLKAQKAQLRNLQLQIKPHFLINTLNMVYNLIETSHLSPARQLIQYSVDFFRYMVKVDADLVPLNEEINHVRAYLGIQSLRYEGQFCYHIEVSPMIHDALIPPVMVQTFVENSMKYALTTTDILHIDIAVTSFEKDFFPYAKIIIRDNGTGYPEEYLSLINAGKNIVKKDGTHIGIRNTIQKLQLLFGEKANLHFYNQDGAVAEIIIPATFLIQDESESSNESELS